MLLDCGWLDAPDAPYGGPCRGGVRVVSGDMRIASDGDSIWIGRDEGPACDDDDDDGSATGVLESVRRLAGSNRVGLSSVESIEASSSNRRLRFRCVEGGGVCGTRPSVSDAVDGPATGTAVGPAHLLAHGGGGGIWWPGTGVERAASYTGTGTGGGGAGGGSGKGPCGVRELCENPLVWAGVAGDDVLG